MPKDSIDILLSETTAQLQIWRGSVLNTFSHIQNNKPPFFSPWFENNY